MKTTELRNDIGVAPTRRSSLACELRQAVRLAMGIGALVVISACTTTERAASDSHPVTRNSSPSTMDELHIAEVSLDSGNLDVATTLFEKIVAADPRSVPGLTGLGNTLYAVGDFTRARVYYERALQVEPEATAPMIGVARVAIHQRRFDEAIATYHKVLALTPSDPLASAGLGAAMDLQGDHAGAQAVLREALNANPGNPTLSINLGLSLTLSGDPRDGANVLLDVTRFPGAPPEARQDLALAYGLLGNADAAAAILGQDLPKASVQDNLRFYALQRERAARPGASANPAPASSRMASVPLKTAPATAEQ
jgi:Flp pilus assembly protein TadD